MVPAGSCGEQLVPVGNAILGGAETLGGALSAEVGHWRHAFKGYAQYPLCPLLSTSWPASKEPPPSTFPLPACSVQQHLGPSSRAP